MTKNYCDYCGSELGPEWWGFQVEIKGGKRGVKDACDSCVKEGRRWGIPTRMPQRGQWMSRDSVTGH